MLKKIALLAASGVLAFVSAAMPAHASSDPDITAEVCDYQAYCWNDAAEYGFLQVVKPTHSSYISINQGSWAGHTTYEWELEGTINCITYYENPASGNNEFVLNPCTAGVPNQGFWYNGTYLVSEGASQPNVNWLVCAGRSDYDGSAVVAVPSPDHSPVCKWDMPNLV